MSTCYACEKGSPTTGQRVCPECSYQFRGNGWDGIDGHWRAKHEPEPLTFEAFMATRCAAHKAPSDRRQAGAGQM
jgi:hypothetical protein